MGGEFEFCHDEMNSPDSSGQRSVLWEGDVYWVKEGTLAPTPPVSEDDWFTNLG